MRALAWVQERDLAHALAANNKARQRGQLRVTHALQAAHTGHLRAWGVGGAACGGRRQELVSAALRCTQHASHRLVAHRVVARPG